MRKRAVRVRLDVYLHPDEEERIQQVQKVLSAAGHEVSYLKANNTLETKRVTMLWPRIVSWLRTGYAVPYPVKR